MNLPKSYSIANKGELIPFEFQLIAVFGLLLMTIIFLLARKFRLATNSLILLTIAVFLPFIAELILASIPWWAAAILGISIFLLAIRAVVALIFNDAIANQMIGDLLGTILQYILIKPFLMLVFIIKRTHKLELLRSTLPQLNKVSAYIKSWSFNKPAEIKEGSIPSGYIYRARLHTIYKQISSTIRAWLREY